MYRCIIHSWSSLLYCIIWTSGLYPLRLYHYLNFICTSPNLFCLRHIQCLSEYHSTQSCRNIISIFTTYIPGMVQNKMSKLSIVHNKSEGIMHSGNQINTRNKTCWKILVWLSKIHLYHCKNCLKLFWPCFILMDLR